LSYTVNVTRNGNQTIDAASAVLRKLEGQIIVSSVPYEKGAEVRVDGELKGVVPATLNLSAGEHEIKIKGKKLQGKKKIVVKDRETVTVQVDIKQGGEKFTNSIGMSFVFIEPGTFMMGSDGESDERPVHYVTLTKGYYMQTTEVTQGQWRKVMGNNPSNFNNCGDDCPVEQVSWDDIQEFIKKLDRMEGHSRYRLPTEAEWEYACRAGSDTPYANDNSLDSMGWYDGNSRSKTHTVAQKQPNNWGLYDMHGNVWEWCQDGYGDYSSGSVSDPEGASSGSRRVLRGGSWYHFAQLCRSASRLRFLPGSYGSPYGFRLALSPGQ
jgi:formylglycine-generating enzyme required for sulfatase activity